MDEQAIRLRCLELAAEIANPQMGETWDFVLCTARLFGDYALTGELPPPPDVINSTEQPAPPAQYGDDCGVAVSQ